MTKNPVGGKLSACDRERADAALTERLARFDHPWTLSAQLSPNGVFVKLFGHQAEDDLTTPPPHI